MPFALFSAAAHSAWVLQTLATIRVPVVSGRRQILRSFFGAACVVETGSFSIVAVATLEESKEAASERVNIIITIL